MTSNKKLADYLANDHIKSGDVILLQSDILRTVIHFLEKKIKISSKDILDVFMSMVGKQGTLLLPTFHFDFCKGYAFDIKNTKSRMGSLSEEARKHPQFARTKHPIHSFCVYGRYKDDFIALNNRESYGDDSPFAKLLELEAKLVTLNLADRDGMSFYHFIEQKMRVEHRFSKDFTGEYIDADGTKQIKTYSMYSRDTEKNAQTYLDPAEAHMWRHHIHKGNRHNEGNGLRMCLAKDLYEETRHIIESGRAEDFLYKKIKT